MHRWLTPFRREHATASVTSGPSVQTPRLLAAYALDALMTAISGDFLDSVHSTGACMVDIRALAAKLAHLPVGQIEPLLLRLADDGEDRALSRLLQACAFNGVKLDPTVLCRCIGVCEEMLDSAPCFTLQDESAVQPLLTAAVAEDLSVERKIYASPPRGRAHRQVRSGPATGPEGALEARAWCAAAPLQDLNRPIAAASGTRLKPRSAPCPPLD